MSLVDRQSRFDLGALDRGLQSNFDQEYLKQLADFYQKPCKQGHTRRKRHVKAYQESFFVVGPDGEWRYSVAE